MTDMNESDREAMEKSWEAYKDLHPPKGQAQFYYKDNGEYWRDGFRDGLAHRDLQIEVYESETKTYKSLVERYRARLEYSESRIATLEFDLNEAREALEDRDKMHDEHIQRIEARRIRLEAECNALAALSRDGKGDELYSVSKSDPGADAIQCKQEPAKSEPHASAHATDLLTSMSANEAPK